MKRLRKGLLAASLAVGIGGAALSAQQSAAGGSYAVEASHALNSGLYVGTREFAFYGYVKVRATIRNGRLTDVAILEFPDHAGRSRYIAGVALPYLVQEAVSVQSARVDLISGATLTSEAFARSLDAALRKAGE